jgi:hypothetical protein
MHTYGVAHKERLFTLDGWTGGRRTNPGSANTGCPEMAFAVLVFMDEGTGGTLISPAPSSTTPNPLLPGSGIFDFDRPYVKRLDLPAPGAKLWQVYPNPRAGGIAGGRCAQDGRLGLISVRAPLRYGRGR